MTHTAANWAKKQTILKTGKAAHEETAKGILNINMQCISVSPFTCVTKFKLSNV